MPSMNLTKRVFFSAFLAVALVLSLAAAAWSQSAGSGTIQGRITDQSGAVIPGAQVTIRSAGIGVSRAMQTNESGEYRAVLLPPGDYEVTVESKGFATVKRDGVRVEVGSTATVNVELRVAAAAETLTVTAEAPITEPERQEVTSIVTEKQVEELPINVRRWDNFALLAPAATPDGTFGLISTRGISGLLNNNTVDGADNNQAFFGEARGRTRVTSTYSQAAIKEFQVGVSNFSAEFGRAAGGTINAVTKSGTNEWHGEVFYNIRDDSLQAREPTLRDNRTGDVLKNKDRRQQYGLATGFPVIADKVFFFGSFEQHYRNESYLATGDQGNFFTTFMTTCAPTGSTAAQITNCTALRDYMLTEAGQHPRKVINSMAFGKVDWQMNQNNRLTGSYNWHRWKSPNGIQTQQTLSRGASDNGFDGVKTDSVVVRVNSVISSNKINEASFQYGRDFEFQTANSSEPRTTITGGVSFGMSEFLPRPAWPDEKRYQWTDNFSWLVGNHTFKMGFDINYVRNKTINIRNGGGEYAYTSLTGLAQDCPLGARALGCVPITTTPPAATDLKHWNRYRQAFDLRGQDGRVFFTTTDYNAYFQDTWKIHPTVTLNLGLRYEYQRLPNVEPAEIGGTQVLGYPGIPETQSLNADTNNFGPRVAVAWDIGGRQKNILRVGGGIYYGRTPNAIIRSHLLENGVALPLFELGTTQLACGPAYPTILSAPPTGAACSGARNVAFLAGDYVRAFIMMVDVSYEREITRNISVSTTYLYTRGNHLTRASDINLNPATTTADILLDADGSSSTTHDRTLLGNVPFYAGLRPMVDVLVAPSSCNVATPAPSCTRLRRVLRQTSDINSRYNAFILQLTQRARFGLTQTAHFTISLAEDEGQAMGASPFAGEFERFFDPRNRKAEFGRSDFDTRKRFVWSFIWEPSRVWSIDNPGLRHAFGDWALSGIVTVHDGQPFNPTISVTASHMAAPSSTTGLCPTTGACASETGSINGSGGSLRFGWLEPNFLETTGFANIDFRVSKDIRIGEQMKIRLLWEAFNLFNRNNHPNRFNFSTTAYRTMSTRTCATRFSTGGCATAAPSSSNLTLLREVILRPDTSFAPIVNLDGVNGTGDLSLCTVADCLRSASGKLFQQRDIQIGVKFIW